MVLITILLIFLGLLVEILGNFLIVLFIKIGANRLFEHSNLYMHLMTKKFEKMDFGFFFYEPYFLYLQAIWVMIFLLWLVNYFRFRKTKRNVENDSDNFGGIRGSSRWARDDEINLWWGKNR